MKKNNLHFSVIRDSLFRFFSHGFWQLSFVFFNSTKKAKRKQSKFAFNYLVKTDWKYGRKSKIPTDPNPLTNLSGALLIDTGGLNQMFRKTLDLSFKIITFSVLLAKIFFIEFCICEKKFMTC